MRLRCLLALIVALGTAQQVRAQDDDAKPDLTKRGAYLATAADCSSCHGSDFRGGDPVASPIGNVYASNISPDKATGIGNWTLRQFSEALRKGKSPDGYLYPAMPYTSYTALSDEDVQALYSYLMLRIAPVTYHPPKTELPFPFFRPAMAVWNLFFFSEGKVQGAVAVGGQQLSRGRYLVEALGHCSVCHTPRGAMMQEQSGKHLGGGMTNGWWAPNLTPDKTGIGDWSDEELTRFLTTGRNHMAAAGGEMGTIVSNSLSKLNQDDIAAIVAYLRKVPAVAVPQPARLAEPAVAPAVTTLEPAAKGDWHALVNHDTEQGGVIFQAACASCHGRDGKGSDDRAFLSLHTATAVTGPAGANLVQTIANGVNIEAGGHVLMPGFKTDLGRGQIAAVANYVRTTFGGTKANLKAQDVANILESKVKAPSWIIRNAGWLAVVAAVGAIIVGLAIIWGVVRWFWRRERKYEQA
jgi:mono/diheme cytochrome c family protein